jgi:DNA-binding transcriptional ArsR family regulator
MTQPSISKHLKVLERAGLISRSRAAQTRPCRLEPAPLQHIAQWVGMYRRLWEASFERLDAHLQSTPSTPKKGKSRGRQQ